MHERVWVRRGADCRGRWDRSPMGGVDRMTGRWADAEPVMEAVGRETKPQWKLGRLICGWAGLWDTTGPLRRTAKCVYYKEE